MNAFEGTRKVLVYDWVTRLFHGLFAVLFLVSYFIANVFEDESWIYPYHMLLGLLLVLTVGLRLGWGTFGSHYARFSSLPLRLKELVGYGRQILRGGASRTLGHNPASAWASLIMMAMAVGLGISGYFMTMGKNGKIFEEAHEIFANGFIASVIAHVAGIAFHTWKHRDGIGFSMIHGRKFPVVGERGITRRHRFAGILFLLIVLTFGIQLAKSYDPQSRTLHILGRTLQMGED